MSTSLLASSYAFVPLICNAPRRAMSHLANIMKSNLEY